MAGWFWLGDLQNSLFESSEDSETELTVGGGVSSKNDFIANVAILDTDGDGLKDWEEVLWGSDVNKKDSDDDGYSDKEEADEGYDPMDASSNSETGEKKPEQEKGDSLEKFLTSVESSSGAGNFTEAMASSMSQQIAENPDTQPDSLSPFAQMDSATTDALAEYIASFNIKISESELKVSDDNSKEAVANYFVEVLQKVPVQPNPDKHDYEIFEEVMQSSNFSMINEHINYYQASITALKRIVTPSELLQLHKRQIELLMATEKVFEAVRDIHKDALKTVLALEQYKKTSEEMEELAEDFSALASKYLL